MRLKHGRVKIYRPLSMQEYENVKKLKGRFMNSLQHKVTKAVDST